MLVRRIARPLLASIFVVGGLDAARNPASKVAAAENVNASAIAENLGLSGPDQLVRVNGIAQVIGGLALATGRFPRLAALGLVASLVPTTAAGHRFWEHEDPSTRAMQKMQFAKNMSILGGLLLAVVDTAGKESVGHKVRRTSGHLIETLP